MENLYTDVVVWKSFSLANETRVYFFSRSMRGWYSPPLVEKRGQALVVEWLMRILEWLTVVVLGVGVGGPRASPPPPHILGKKKITKGRKASRASDKKFLLAQGLDPPLINIWNFCMSAWIWYKNIFVNSCQILAHFSCHFFPICRCLNV